MRHAHGTYISLAVEKKSSSLLYTFCVAVHCVNRKCFKCLLNTFIPDGMETKWKGSVLRKGHYKYHCTNKQGGLFTSILDHVYLALSSGHYNGYFTLTHGNCAHPTVNGREVASLSSHCECINTKEQQLPLWGTCYRKVHPPKVPLALPVPLEP